MNLNDFIVILMFLVLLYFFPLINFVETSIFFSYTYWILLIPLFIMLLFLTHLKNRNISNTYKKSCKFFRIWFPWIAALIVYENLVYITSKLQFSIINEMLIDLDLFLLGFHPSEYFQIFINPLLTDYLTLVYLLGYVLVPPIIGLYFYSKDKKFTYVYIRAILLAMALGFLCYTLFPAIQPKYYCPECYDLDIRGNLIQDSDKLIQSIDDHAKNAFPSLHTAISTLVLFYAFKFNRKLGLIILPISISIWIATLYLRVHYFVDLIAGWILVFLIIMFAEDLESIFHKYKLKLLTFLR